MVQNGLVYVVDIDLGLYVLKYTGKHAAEVAHTAFLEGNSSGRAVPRSATAWAHIMNEVRNGPVTVMSPYRQADAKKLYGFFCL